MNVKFMDEPSLGLENPVLRGKILFCIFWGFSFLMDKICNKHYV